MFRIKTSRRWSVLMGILFITTPVAALTQSKSAPARQGEAQTTAAKVAIARGCLRNASDLGGQGGGGQAWQGSIAGHVLTGVHIESLPTSEPASSKTASPQVLLILGIAENQLRPYRDQQVEVQGTLGTTRDVSRASSGSRDGSERAGAPASGQSASEPNSPKVGTGGSLRVPSSPRPGVNQAPTEFHATSIRGIARSCPTPAR